jgi:hypothetical protein
MARFRQFSFKQFGYLDFNHDLPRQLSQQDFTSFVKIVFLRAGGHAVIDFKEYHLEQDALFFTSAGQYHQFDDTCSGTLLYYKPDYHVPAQEPACSEPVIRSVIKAGISHGPQQHL